MMSDTGQLPLDGEHPVNPYSLLEAVNRASDTVNTAWLIFLGVMSYLLITAAGVTHKDMLLNNDIPLPILQVKIDLGRFFFFAPIILFLFHTGVVAQLALLARKALEFDTSIRMLETTEKRSHPLRLELDNFFFVQGIAGPERSQVMSAFLHGLSWLTLVVLPVLILLYVQVVFLPYHDPIITTAHRVALFADIVMLATIGTFLARSENSFFTAFRRTLAQHPKTGLFTALLFFGVTAFSLFIATIPGERLDRITDAVTGRGSKTEGRSGYLGFALPFVKPSEDGSLFGLFYRNLVVRDADLVVDNQVTPGESTINLRGRDLRYARLDRTDLHQADFTGANLDGASFVQSDLRNATMSCADIDRLLLGDGRTEVKCTSARGANFTRARMGEAKLAGGDFGGAVFDHTALEGADMRYLLAQGADFTSANLQRVDLSGNSVLHGTLFLTASLQGADLTTAELTLANFVSANLHGAILSFARLEGARFLDADLDGADMQNARLYGADLTNAKIGHADLRGATLWKTKPPEIEGAGTADLSPLTSRPPDQLDLASLKDIIAQASVPGLKGRLEDGLNALITARDGQAWASSPDAQRWGQMQTASKASAEGFKQTLSEGLAKLACRASFANGAVAIGVAKRAMRPTFKGDMSAVYQRLRSADCPASRAIPAKFLTEFGLAADIARGQ
jgi:uncharacterized protein YjbI with pentapeptide repeats